jgi:hypothetical protein
VVGDPAFQARASRSDGGTHLRREQCQPVQLRGGADTARGQAGFLVSGAVRQTTKSKRLCLASLGNSRCVLNLALNYNGMDREFISHRN